MPASITPNQFVDKWRSHQLNERAAYQQHFLDLCALVNTATPMEKDPTGSFYRFEAGACKDSRGWSGKKAGPGGVCGVWVADDLSDEEILASLLALNLERAGKPANP
jgi:hypothetical protein